MTDSLNDALGLVWPHDPLSRTHTHGTTMLSLTSQHLDGTSEPAFA
ncbi:hypothetical protein [Candidatus Poriferisodalis sp.]